LLFGTDSHGDLYLLSKANGEIWKNHRYAADRTTTVSK
jgi:hypothetical protein